MDDVDNPNLEQFAEECFSFETEAETIARIQEILFDMKNSDSYVDFLNILTSKTDKSEVLTFLLKEINKMRSKKSVPVIVDILIKKHPITDAQDEEDTHIRVNCTKILANLKDTSAVNPLLYCLNNKNENYKLRLSCAEALGKIGDRFAVTPLVDVLKDDNEKSVYIKESAAFALGMIGDVKAVESLVSILENKKGIISKFTFLKERAIEALSKINSKSDKVFNALKDSLKDESPQIRINAIEALLNLDDERVFDLIKDMLNDTDSEVVKNAVIALFNINGEDILQEILNDEKYNDTIKDIVKDVLQEIENDEEEDN